MYHGPVCVCKRATHFAITFDNQDTWSFPILIFFRQHSSTVCHNQNDTSTVVYCTVGKKRGNTPVCISERMCQCTL